MEVLASPSLLVIYRPPWMKGFDPDPLTTSRAIAKMPRSEMPSARHAKNDLPPGRLGSALVFVLF